MRLIDADAFEELFDKQIKYGATDIFEAVEDALQDTPTIDAVPVVRCKDCKHWGMLEGPPETASVKCCELGQYMVGANSYCVYGGVKDDD